VDHDAARSLAQLEPRLCWERRQRLQQPRRTTAACDPAKLATTTCLASSSFGGRVELLGANPDRSPGATTTIPASATTATTATTTTVVLVFFRNPTSSADS